MIIKVILIFLFFIYYILYCVSYYELFKKMGLIGWKSLIPVYSEYLLYKRNDEYKKFGKLCFFINLFLLIIITLCFIALFLIIFMIVMLFGFVLATFLIALMFEETKDLFNCLFNAIPFVLMILSIGLFLFSIVRSYMFYKISLRFGKNNRTATIFGIFNFIGVIILGFDKSTYIDKNKIE